MFRMFSHVINVVMFGSLALLAYNVGQDAGRSGATLTAGANRVATPGSRGPVVRTVTEVPAGGTVRTVQEIPASPVRTVTEVPSGSPVRTLNEAPAPTATASGPVVKTIAVTPVPVVAPKSAGSSRRAAVEPPASPSGPDTSIPASGPRLFSPSSPLLAPGSTTGTGTTATHTPRSAEAVVPPLVRRKPAAASEAGGKSRDKSGRSVKGRDATDLSGRSGLGAGAGSGVDKKKCAAGQTFDRKARKCSAQTETRRTTKPRAAAPEPIRR